MAKRKLKNSGPIDAWLEELGFYRKNVAYDETCLFRAIAEQEYFSQMFHERVRKEIITFGNSNRDMLLTLVHNDDECDLLLERLYNHMAVCGLIEMHMISHTYSKQIMLFDGLNQAIKHIGADDLEGCFYICHTGGDHYDVIHKKSYIEDAGFCQSIVYGIVYENVFNISNVSNIVQEMLYQKQERTDTEFNNNDVGDINLNLLKLNDSDDDKKDELKVMIKTNLAPFPFKIAKALDPTIYRNIEYDTWIEMRREMRLGDWYFGDNNLIRGSACVLKQNNTELKCYIQEINKNDNMCVVYIINSAEKRSVELKDLKPEANAKPWPMPYRFTKNLLFTLPSVGQIEKRSGRRKKERKEHLKINNPLIEVNGNVTNCDIDTYTGTPLQVQWSQGINETDTQNQNTVNGNESIVNAMLDEVWTSPDYLFQTKPSTNTQDQINQNYTYDVWSSGQYGVTQQTEQSPPSTLQQTELQATTPQANYYFNDNGIYPQTYFAAPERQYPVQHSYTPTYQDAYSPVVSMSSPSTPIIYSTPETPIFLPATPNLPVPSPYIALPSPHVVSPHITVIRPMEVPYVDTSPFVYPVMSPVTWYPQGINAQGFIYPTPENQQV